MSWFIFLDRESFSKESYQLSTEQFQTIVKHFQYIMDEKPRADGRLVIQHLAMKRRVLCPESMFDMVIMDEADNQKNMIEKRYRGQDYRM